MWPIPSNPDRLDEPIDERIDQLIDQRETTYLLQVAEVFFHDTLC